MWRRERRFSIFLASSLFLFFGVKGGKERGGEMQFAILYHE
jgi:hypothetical protein